MSSRKPVGAKIVRGAETTEPAPFADIYPDISIGHNEPWAVGVPAILNSMEPALLEMGPARTAKLALTITNLGNVTESFSLSPTGLDRPGLK